jgi:hypothetical protein
MQRIVRVFKETTGQTVVDLHEVVQWAVKRGWPLPRPVDPYDRLVKEFAAAEREEIRHDEVTGRPYRANHAVPVMRNGQLAFSWVDIDDATRPLMEKSVAHRREQMVGDGLQLSLDVDHWNRVHPTDDPLAIELDIGPDVEWAKNAPDEDEESA